MGEQTTKHLINSASDELEQVGDSITCFKLPVIAKMYHQANQQHIENKAREKQRLEQARLKFNLD